MVKRIPPVSTLHKPATMTVHVFRCPRCRRAFERKTDNFTFKRHQDRKGQPCPGAPLFETEKIIPVEEDQVHK